MGPVKAIGPSAEERILSWFTDLGVSIPPPSPQALRWTNSEYIDIPVEDAIEDEDLVFTPDEIDLVMLAEGVAYMTRDAERTFPGKSSWRRLKLTSWTAGKLYTLGITRDGGSMSMDGGDPTGKPIYTMPHFRGVLPRRGARLRSYVLGKPDWYWQCLRSQGWKIRGRHKPIEPMAWGVCALCLPCLECGAPYICASDCPTLAHS